MYVLHSLGFIFLSGMRGRDMSFWQVFSIDLLKQLIQLYFNF